MPSRLAICRRSDAEAAAVGKHLIEQQSVAGDIFAAPLLMHPGLVPSHYLTSAKYGGQSWQPNALTGGDFESLQQMMAGWLEEPPRCRERNNHSGRTQTNRRGRWYLRLAIDHSGPCRQRRTGCRGAVD